MGRFSGKTALITGGTSGIGLSAARAFLDEGARVAITGRDPKALEVAKKELGGGALAFLADAGRVADADKLAADVKRELGGLDALFVNAGIARFAPAEQSPEALWDEIFAINAKGAFFTVQKLIPLLNKGAGVVLNTSVVNVKGLGNSAVYSASKAALRSLARTLATELLPRGVRVNAVSPGPITTPIFSKSGLGKEQIDEFATYARELVPMKRFGSPDEVVRAALFLASSEASFITGSELAVDGGLSQL